MILKDAVKLALRGLWSHKLRSGLTMLGLVIGVAAVVLLTALGAGVTGAVNAAVEPVANSITVAPKVSPIPSGPSAKPLTDGDMEAILEAPQVGQVVPVVNGSTTGAAGQTAKALVASTSGAQYKSASVTGTTANYATVQDMKLTAGMFFTDQQEKSKAKVAVIGPLVAGALYGEDPNAALGQTLRLDHAVFEVIGVLESYGASVDSAIVMPIKTARANVFGKGTGGQELSQLIVKATSVAEVSAAEEQVITILRERHHVIDPRYDDFQAQSLGARVSTFTGLIQLIAGSVPLIAGISLLVGGVGVLNIMLVSVTDRTREIGTRKAVGASDTAIMSQFVLEALTVAGTGGLVGILLSVGLLGVIKLVLAGLGTSAGFLSSFAPVLSLTPVLVSFGISLVIGLIAGGYPAWRAARLEPIEALRFE